MLCPNLRWCSLWTLGVASLLVPLATAEAGELLRLDDPLEYELQAVGFELGQTAAIHVDAKGLRPRHAEDLSVYGWILDAETREPVWEMKRGKTKRASGSRVLRTAVADVELEAGHYELYFFAGTAWSGDVSIHISGGVTGVLKRLWRDHDDDDDDGRFGDYEDEIAECYIALSSDDIARVETFEVTGGFDDALIAFTKVGDSEYFKKGIEISRPMSFHVYSVFEFPKGDETPADYGWIMNADTREVAWMPTKASTRRGGGGSKNRVFNDEITLNAGRYIVRFGTDDSHSYEKFNVRPPYDPVNWGLVISGGDDFSATAFSTFDVERRGDVIFEATEVGDDAFIEQTFRLNRGGHLGIYAIGEYAYEFADYGWIVNNKTGRTVWEMTRRNTLPAGGAEKNRMFEGAIELDPGEYTVFYTTDGSHSYERWNSATPFEPEAWGITLTATSDLSAADVELLDAPSARASGDILVQIVRVGDEERRRETFTLERPTLVHVYALGEGSGGDMYDYGYIVEKGTGRRVWRMRYRDSERAGGASKNRKVDIELDLEPGAYEVVYVTDDSHSFEEWNDRRPLDPTNWGITVRRSE